MAGTRRVVVWLRRIGRRAIRFFKGEFDAETLRSVPSWGVSLLMHGLLLLILALFIQARRASEHPEALFESTIGQAELGEVTSLAPDKRSGDPFTKEQSLNPPSIGLEPEHSGLQMTGQPHLASLTQYAPNLAGPSAMPDKLKVGRASRRARSRSCPTWRRRSSHRFRAARV